VDAGDLLWKSERLDEARLPQQRVKGDLLLRAYAQGGIDAMLFGESDLSLGVDWLSARVQDLELPAIATNMTCEGMELPTYRVVHRGGLTVGFLGVSGRATAGKCTYSLAVPAVKTAITEMGVVDLLVLLSHQDSKADEALVEALPEVDLVVNGHGRKSIKTPKPLGQTALQLSTGTRGKKLGVARVLLVEGGSGFQVDGAAEELESKLKKIEARLKRAKSDRQSRGGSKNKGALDSRIRRLSRQVDGLQSEIAVSKEQPDTQKHRIRNRLRPLNDKIDDHPDIHALVQAAKPLIDAAAAIAVPRSKGAHSAFVGEQACLSCHPSQHAQWKSTPHAYAWSTLQQVGRSKDLECWSCHVTGANQPSGPQHPSQVEGLENVGCESCHGPGIEHISGPAKTNIQRQPKLDVCTQCHDGVKDEGRFEPDKYMSQVTH